MYASYEYFMYANASMMALYKGNTIMSLWGMKGGISYQSNIRDPINILASIPAKCVALISVLLIV